MSLNNDMGDEHEDYLAALFGGTKSKGSGNQWKDPMDGRTSRKHLKFAFAWDGKSTLAKSMSIPRTMLAKAVEQALGERPMIGVRFYRDEKLRVDEDWVLVKAEDFAEVLAAANGIEE